MFCKKCGTEVPYGAAFCENCGTPVAAEENTYQEPVTNVTEYYQEAPAAPAVDPGKTLGTVSLILGIVSVALGLLCSCLGGCIGGFIPLVCGIVGLILSIMGSKKSTEAGFENKNAKIGMILSIAGIAVFVVMIIINAIAGGIMASTGMLEELMLDLGLR